MNTCSRNTESISICQFCIMQSCICNTNLCIQCPLQLQHVGVLLRIDVIIWEIHQETVDVEPKIKRS